MAFKLKSEGTFFSSTLKVGENKVPLFFRFVACVLRYCHFVILLISAIWTQTKKMRKWRYLSPETTNLKNKGTFFSSTLKVEKNKVSSFFRFVVSGLRYGHFLIFLVRLQVSTIIEMTKWPYLSPEVPNPKNKGPFCKVPLFF